MTNKHIGSSFDSFLEEEGTREEVNEQATKRVLAWQIEQAMKEQGITKKRHGEAHAHQPRPARPPAGPGE